MITLSNNTKGLALLHQVVELCGKVHTKDPLFSSNDVDYRVIYVTDTRNDTRNVIFSHFSVILTTLMSASKVYMYLNQTHKLYKTHFKTPGTPIQKKCFIQFGSIFHYYLPTCGAYLYKQFGSRSGPGQQIARPDLHPNCLKLWWYSLFFPKKVILKKSADNKTACKIYKWFLRYCVQSCQSIKTCLSFAVGP